MNKLSIILTVSFLALAIAPSLGQSEWTDQRGEIEDAEIVIEKDRKIELPQASRNYVKVKVQEPEKEPKPQTFDKVDYTLKLPDIQPKVKVLVMKPDPLEKLYGNYVKAGVGNYGPSTYLEGYFNTKRSEQFAYGAHVKHLNFGDGPVDDAGNSDNSAKLHAKYFNESMTFGGDLGYRRQSTYFYGNRDIESLDLDSLKQVYSTIAGHGFIEGHEERSPLDYRVDIGASYLSDDFEVSEFLFDLGLGGRFKISPNAGVNLHADLGIAKYTSDTLEQTRNFFRVRPNYEMRIDALHFRIGLVATYDNDTFQDVNNFHIYPDLYADYQLSGDKVILFAGLTGDSRFNTLHSYVTMNQWVQKDLLLLNSHKTLDIYGGLKGNVSNRTAYKVGVSYQNWEYLNFLINDPTDTARFVAVYDTETTTVLNLNLEVTHNVSDRFRLGLGLDYYNYDVSNIGGMSRGPNEAWHLPTLSAKVSGTYNLKDKILFNMELYALNGIKAYDANLLTREEDRVVELDGIYDMNLRVDYRFSQKFSTFLQLNNLFAQEYERYLNYQSRSFQAMIGLTYAF